MSYCVNCGVELDESLKQCPLCQVEIVNPAKPYDKNAPRPYSHRIDHITRRVDRHFTAIIATVVLLFIIGVCMLADEMYSERIDWSIYVSVSLALCWVLLIFPMAFDRIHPIFYILADVVALTSFLYAIELMTGPGSWFDKVALPIIYLLGVISALCATLIRAKILKGLHRSAWVAGSAAISVLGVEALLDNFMDGRIVLDWSWFAAVPLITLALILTLIERKTRLKDAIFRRLHI
jgi:peptidoglycan/LPS O-acetylase OafA/YrhL